MRCVVGLSRGCVSAAIVRLWLRSGGGGGGVWSGPGALKEALAIV